MDSIPPNDLCCHHTGFAKKCRTLVTSGKCNRWMQIQGSNPNTGEPVNRYDCVDNWTPLLLIENSQMQRQTGAAVESFRNEVANQPPLLTRSMIDVTPPGPPRPKQLR